MIRVTQHAIERYQERVRNVTDEDARAALSCAAIVIAAQFGAPYLKLGTGQHVVIKDGAVVTVLPKDHNQGRMRTGLDRGIDHGA